MTSRRSQLANPERLPSLTGKAPTQGLVDSELCLFQVTDTRVQRAAFAASDSTASTS